MPNGSRSFRQAKERGRKRREKELCILGGKKGTVCDMKNLVYCHLPWTDRSSRSPAEGTEVVEVELEMEHKVEIMEVES